MFSGRGALQQLTLGRRRLKWFAWVYSSWYSKVIGHRTSFLSSMKTNHQRDPINGNSFIEALGDGEGTSTDDKFQQLNVIKHSLDRKLKKLKKIDHNVLSLCDLRNIEHEIEEADMVSARIVACQKKIQDALQKHNDKIKMKGSKIQFCGRKSYLKNVDVWTVWDWAIWTACARIRLWRTSPSIKLPNSFKFSQRWKTDHPRTLEGNRQYNYNQHN